MKLAVLSDTHGNYPLAIRAIDLIDRPDLVIHLGDTGDDAEIIEHALGLEVIKLSGNCDSPRQFPEILTLTLAGRKILFSHGDLFHVKRGLEAISRRGAEEGAEIVLFGHTHIPCIWEDRGLLLVNPGALKGDTTLPSMAVIELGEDRVTSEIIALGPRATPSVLFRKTMERPGQGAVGW